MRSTKVDSRLPAYCGAARVKRLCTAVAGLVFGGPGVRGDCEVQHSHQQQVLCLIQVRCPADRAALCPSDSTPCTACAQAVAAHASRGMSEIAAPQVVTVCRGHHMPVYTVRWNLLHTRTFLSCGADWALKVWDESKPKKVTSADS